VKADESVFDGFTREGAESGGSGLSPRGDREDLRRLAGHDQTLSQAATRNRHGGPQSHSRASQEETLAVARRTASTLASPRRLAVRRPLPVVGADSRGHGQHGEDEPRDQAAGLDAQKKTLAASERREEERARFRQQMKDVDPKRLVVVDESGSHIALTPLYARAPRGERAHGSVPRNRGKNTTLLAALSLSGIGACMILEGAVNAQAFEAYVEQILAPSLAPGQIVLMDNLSVHKRARVRQLIEARGCELRFLPAYSPDSSPIEETFSKLKASLCRVGARTHEALAEAIGQALETVTAADALGWFRHCGYFPADSRAS